MVVVGKSRGNTHLSSEIPCCLTFPPPLLVFLSLSLSLGVWWTEEIFPRGSSFQPPDYYLWTQLSQLATCRGEIQHTHTFTHICTHTLAVTPRGSAVAAGGMELPGDPAALGKESMPSVRSWPCAGCDMSKIAVYSKQFMS